MSNDKDSMNMSDLAAALNEEDRAGLVNALKNKIQSLAGQHSDILESLSPVVRKPILNLQTQHDELEAKFFEERAALEAKYQKLYQPLYSKRYEIVNGVVEAEGATTEAANQEDNAAEEKGVPDFWLNAMKNNEVLAEEITERDEGALKYLRDIKWFRIDNPKGFKLEFYFDTNPFFKNSVLTKIYHMIDEDEPILEKAIGTEIEWYPAKCLTQKLLKKKPKKGSKNAKPITRTENCESFFNFFSPPQVPEDDEDIEEDAAEELQNQMEQDYDIGSTIRDKIIPHAVSWFTGEAIQGDDFGDLEDDEDDDIEDEDEDDEDEDEDEDDDEDDEDEDEGKTKKTSSAHKKSGRAQLADGQQGERPPECKQQSCLALLFSYLILEKLGCGGLETWRLLPMARLLRNALSMKRFLVPPQVHRRGILGPSTQLCNFSSKGRKKSKSDGSDSNEENMSKKDLALQQALDQITSSFGKGSIMWLGRSPSPRQVPVVSTGSFALDLALGTGGFPKGRVVEIFGPEASGKTTLALHVIAEAQKQGGYCVFVDAEHALDPSLAQAIGVNTENLLLSQPDCGEQALSLVDTLIRSGSVDVVVVDSVAALVPKGELDGEMGDAHMAMQARLMSQALRKLSHSLSLSQTILIFTNQVRSKISTFGGFGGPTEVPCGGNALKFYASVRLNIRRIGLIKKGEETLGSQVQVKIVKNKLAPPFRTVHIELEFGKGICRESEIIELGVKNKFVTKSGSHYNLNGQNFHGKDALKRFLAENNTAMEELTTKLREKLVDVVTDNEAETEPMEEIVSPDSTDEDAVTAVGT
ncbi:unnamed protein product [Prunus brigantina]